jgi:hypothetical protein
LAATGVHLNCKNLCLCPDAIFPRFTWREVMADKDASTFLRSIASKVTRQLKMAVYFWRE